MNFLADWIFKRFITHQNLINCFSNSYRTSPIALNGKCKYRTTGVAFAFYCKRRERQYGIYTLLGAVGIQLNYLKITQFAQNTNYDSIIKHSGHLLFPVQALKPKTIRTLIPKLNNMNYTFIQHGPKGKLAF